MLKVVDATGDGVPELVQWAPCDAPDVLRLYSDDWSQVTDVPLPGPRECWVWDVVPVDGDCFPDVVHDCDGVAFTSGPDFLESTTRQGLIPTGTLSYNCSSGKTTRESKAYWADLEGDGDQDLVVTSDPCDRFQGTGWAEGMPLVSLPPASRLRPQDVTPGPGDELVGECGPDLCFYEAAPSTRWRGGSCPRTAAPSRSWRTWTATAGPMCGIKATTRAPAAGRRADQTDWLRWRRYVDALVYGNLVRVDYPLEG